MADHLNLNEEQQMLLETIDQFTKDEVRPGAGERDLERAFPEGAWEGLAELGLMGVAYSEDVGGVGLGWLTHALVVESLARGCAATAMTFVAHANLAMGAIVRAGSDEQKARWMEELCTGETLGALALGAAEVLAGPAAGGVTASKSGEGWLLHGTATTVVNGSRAGLIVVHANVDGGGTGLFVVPGDAVSLERGAPHHTSGLRAADYSDLTFEGVAVRPDDALDGDADAIVREVLDASRVSFAAIAVGIARDALDRSYDYSKERQMFGRRLADFDGTLEKFSTMASATEAARRLLYAAATAQDAGDGYASIATMAQLQAARVAHDVAYEAVQIFGGYGYCHEYAVERLQRDAKMIEIGIDETAFARRALAKALAAI